MAVRNRPTTPTHPGPATGVTDAFAFPDRSSTTHTTIALPSSTPPAMAAPAPPHHSRAMGST